MSFVPGSKVEHFTIVSLLGEGGMGQVYVALDTRLQRTVALKIVHPQSLDADADDGTRAARLLREAQCAAALEHPNVVTIFEVGEIGAVCEERARPFIAMELVKGRALSTFVDDPNVSTERKIRWLADVARALAAAHRAGVIHRDIKPENVMVNDDDVVKVLDFGIAKRAVIARSTSSTEEQLVPSLTAKGAAVGTPYYMAPEQMRREPLDGRADQFSWGVLAYELLAGRPPWGRAVDALELVSKILTEDPAPLEGIRPDLPSYVLIAVARALSKRREARFATMDALLASLVDTRFARGALEPLISKSAAPTEHQGAFRFRRRIKSVAIAGIVIFLTFGALYRMTFGEPSRGTDQRVVLGCGVVRTEARALSGFTELALPGLGDVTLAQTGTESLSIDAEDNILPELVTTVTGHCLTLSVRGTISPSRPIHYTVSVKNLTGIEIAGAGNVAATQIDAVALRIALLGAGTLTIAGKTQSQNVVVAGAGSYEAYDLASKAATLRLSGAGNAFVRVSESLDAGIIGLGHVTFLGDPTVKESIEGLGRVQKR